MDITFSLQNGQYIAEFKVTSEFNLHIEKGVGTMQMLQRTSGTFFDKVEDFKMEKGDVVYDFDSGSFIGEKTIRLVSSVEPRYCFITTSGEVTEIKSQSKEVEVTSNGTMDITPDAGFSYLNSVKVKTNVPTSGEGGGSGTPLSKDMIYLDLSDYTMDDKTMIANYALFAKYKDESGNAYFVNPWAFAGTSTSVWSDMDYFAVFSSLIVQGSDGNNASVIDELSVVFPNFSAIPRITKEEFYNLNA